jgi:hypothetical protein
MEPPADAPPQTAAAPGGPDPFRPNVSRHAVRLGPTAWTDLLAAFGGMEAAGVAFDRFEAQRARRSAGELTDWPGDDDHCRA